jgi:hypothetical protein
MTPKPRYLIIFRESKAEGARRDQYTIGTQRVFTDLDEAIDRAEGIDPSRKPRVVTFVWPEAEDDIYVDDEGNEFFFLGETSRKGEGDLVWLLDEEDKQVGMTKAAFERKLRQKSSDGS